MAITLEDWYGGSIEITLALSAQVLGDNSARLIAVTSLSPGLDIRMPDATTIKPGQWYVIVNDATNSFVIEDNQGGDIPDNENNSTTTVAANEAAIVTCINTDDAAGKWRAMKRSTAAEADVTPPFAYFFGLNGANNETWELNQVTSVWSEQTANSSNPHGTMNDGFDSSMCAASTTRIYYHHHAGTGEDDSFVSYNPTGGGGGTWDYTLNAIDDSLTPPPTGIRRNSGFAALFSDNTSVWGVGLGFSESGTGTESEEVFKYSIGGDSWTRVTFSSDRIAGTGASFRNSGNTIGYGCIASTETFKITFSTDVVSEEVAQCPINTARDAGEAAFDDNENDKIYVTGGEVDGQTGSNREKSDQVWRFNMADDTADWVQRDSITLDPKEEARATGAGSFAYLYGGKIKGASSEETVKTTYKYSFDSDVWTLEEQGPYAESSIFTNFGRGLVP